MTSPGLCPVHGKLLFGGGSSDSGLSPPCLFSPREQERHSRTLALYSMDNNRELETSASFFL